MMQLDSNEHVNFAMVEHYDVHLITGCVKTFFRELPEPLFTFERYDALIQAAST